MDTPTDKSINARFTDYMRVMAKTALELRISTEAATYLNGHLTGILINRRAVHEAVPADTLVAQYREAFERGLQESLANADHINAVFTAPV